MQQLLRFADRQSLHVDELRAINIGSTADYQHFSNVLVDETARHTAVRAFTDFDGIATGRLGFKEVLK